MRSSFNIYEPSKNPLTTDACCFFVLYCYCIDSIVGFWRWDCYAWFL